MRTYLEINLFLEAWKPSLGANLLSQIQNFIGGMEVAGDNSVKISRSQNLPSVFLTWLESDYEVSRFDKVYYTNGVDVCVGVVRNINRRTGEIIFYCSYSYSLKVLDLDVPRCTLGYQIRPCTESEYKRLKRELARVGMVWKDKLHRLEPEKVKGEVGSTYWYISDTLQIVADKEELDRRSHLRYMAGNYFTDYGKALEVCDKVREILKCNLAKIGSFEE